MIITATPQPENFPPRIRLDIDSEGDEFLELTVLRDGRPIRQQPAVMGLSETFVYDYEAPFGVPVTYSASGSTTDGSWTSSYSEDWADLDGWAISGDNPTPNLPMVEDGRFKLVSGVRGSIFRGAPTGAARVVIPTVGTLDPADASLVEMFGVRLSRASSGTGGGTATVSMYLDTWTSRNLVVNTSQPVRMTFNAARTLVELSQGASSVSMPLPGTGQTMTRAVINGTGGSLGPFSIETPSTPASVTASTTAQLDISEAWLIHPIQPSLSIPIERFSHGGEMSVAASTDETRTYASRQAIYQPNGRREAVSYPLGPRGAGSWTLVLTLENIEARNDLMTLLDDQAPVLLRSPSEADWDLPDGWYSVGDVDVSRPIDIGGVELRRATLPLTKVAEPPVKIAPQLTWGDLMLRGIKWGDLLSKTWLQSLMGEV